MVKLNRVDEPISIQYKMVHGLDQVILRTQNFQNLVVMDLSSSVTPRQKKATSAIQWNVINTYSMKNPDRYYFEAIKMTSEA